MDKRKVVFARLSKASEIMLDDITTYNEVTQNSAASTTRRTRSTQNGWVATRSTRSVITVIPRRGRTTAARTIRATQS